MAEKLKFKKIQYKLRILCLGKIVSKEKGEGKTVFSMQEIRESFHESPGEWTLCNQKSNDINKKIESVH